MKKKYIGMMLLFIMSMWLVACRGNASTDQKDDLNKNIGESQLDTEIESVPMRDVVFMNSFRYGMHGSDEDLREIILCQYDLSDDKETLYAFYIYPTDIPKELEMAAPKQEENENYELELQNWQEQMDSQLKAVLLQEGFAIISHPQLPLVFAGTMSQWEALFEERDGRIGEWGIWACSVGRPDAPEIFSKTGWTVGEDIEEWFNDHDEEILPLLGTDARQVTLTVPVILPEEAAE